MNIPLNGRIAIIDDKIDQALPLINALAQKRRPYLYYTGDVKYLPEEGNSPNDIRILFLDINLIDDREHEAKVLKGRLIPVLKRIISKDNYPYVLVFWSRNEQEHGAMVKEIFNNELKDRKPIAFIREESKLSYFKADGEPVEDHEQNVARLFDNISNHLSTLVAYDNMLNWENKVHLSADKTLQEIFSSCHTYESWSDNAGFLIHSLGESYSGKSTYKGQTHELKLKSSFQAFNNVFFDTLEYLVTSSNLSNVKELIYNRDLAKKETIYSVNKKLLISDDKNIIYYPGAVNQSTNENEDSVFQDLLNNSLNRKAIEEEIINDPANKEKEKGELVRLAKKGVSDKRKSMRETWKKIYFVVTPLCDFVQNKLYNSRVIKGILIKAEYGQFIDNRSEAIFISPKFKHEEDTYILILHFRYFFTVSGADGIQGQPLFRVRQQLISEVQSKLARHISRQGVLFIDENV